MALNSTSLARVFDIDHLLLQIWAWPDLRGVSRSSDWSPGPSPESETQEHRSYPSCLCQDILNHVFDDVESFVSRLQKSAEATRVLEHRERGRRTRRRAAGGKGEGGLHIGREHTFLNGVQISSLPGVSHHQPGLTS